MRLGDSLAGVCSYLKSAAGLSGRNPRNLGLASLALCLSAGQRKFIGAIELRKRQQFFGKWFVLDTLSTEEQHDETAELENKILPRHHSNHLEPPPRRQDIKAEIGAFHDRLHVDPIG